MEGFSTASKPPAALPSSPRDNRPFAAKNLQSFGLEVFLSVREAVSESLVCRVAPAAPFLPPSASGCLSVYCCAGLRFSATSRLILILVPLSAQRRICYFLDQKKVTKD